MKTKILILTLTLILLITFTFHTFAVEQVVESLKYSPSACRLALVGNTLQYYTLYNYGGESSVEIPFTKYATAFNLPRGSFRYYIDYNINDDLSIYSGRKYILLETTVALNTANTNNSQSYFYFYSHEGDIEQAQIQIQRDTEIITVEFQGVDINVYSNYCLLEIDDIEYFANNVGRVSYNQYFETLDTTNQTIFSTDLSLKIFDDVESAVDEILYATDAIVKQNQIMIQNQKDMMDKLDDIMNAGPSDEDVSDVNSFFDDENAKNEFVGNLEESMSDKVNQGFDQSIDMNTSAAESTVEEVFQNTDIKDFFNHLYQLPIVAFAFTILPTFWIAYIVLFRG